MGSNFYYNNRSHPYAPPVEIKSRLSSRHSLRRRPDTSQGPTTHGTSTQSSKCGKNSLQASRVGKYLIFAKGLWNSSLHCAIDTETKREYACRLLSTDKYREYIAPYFQIEQHDNINKIVEVLLGENNAYVIFEPSYGDLHSYVRSKRRLKEAESCRLFKQIVETVNHCHQNGVILRDLKLRKFVFQNKERWEAIHFFFLGTLT